MNSGIKQSNNSRVESSKRFPGISVTFIELLFAVAVNLGFAQIAKREWFNTTSWNIMPAYLFEIFVILLGYSTLLLSWWYYHRIVREKQGYEDGLEGKFRFCVDILIVTGYWLLLVKFDQFDVVLWLIAAIYLLYIAWDLLWVIQEKGADIHRNRCLSVTLLWSLFMLIILATYLMFQYKNSLPTPSEYSPPVLIHWILVVLAHIINILYRLHQKHLLWIWLLDFRLFVWLFNRLTRKRNQQ